MGSFEPGTLHVADRIAQLLMVLRGDCRIVELVDVVCRFDIAAS